MFIDPKADTIFTQVDERALAVMKKSGVPIMPMLSNNFKTQLLGEPVHRILTNPAQKRTPHKRRNKHSTKEPFCRCERRP